LTKKIVVLDTAVNDPNLGNEIIMDAVNKELRAMFPHDYIFHVPALEYIRAGRNLVESADHVFLGGTNVLSSDMNRTSEWRIRLRDRFWLNNVILMGVGWWQYQDMPINLYTKFLLHGVLKANTAHSVRDSYTANKLSPFRLEVLNTACPTMWRLDEDHCRCIPENQSDRVLLTYTVYNRDEGYDCALFEIIKRNYSKILFWPQQPGDFDYAHNFLGIDIEVVDPSLAALDDALSTPIDYIGTRLHAGIRSMQYQRRSIIIGVDNRATEMGKDFRLPVICRAELQTHLENRIRSKWQTDVRLPQRTITEWKEQFDEK